MKKGVSPIVVMPDRKDLFQDIEAMQISTLTATYRDNTYPPIREKKDYLLFPFKLIARRLVNHRAVKQLARQLQGRHIDLIHTNVSVCSIGYQLSRKLHVPHVYHIREYADIDFNMYFFPTRKAYLRQLAQPDSYSVCITKDIQRHFHQENASSSIVVYNGIQNQTEEMPNVPKDDFFLFAGKIDPSKGVLELFEAYYDYKCSAGHAIPLYVMGEQTNAGYLRKLTSYIRQHNLQNDITIYGPRTDIRQFMQKTTAIIIPSLNEAFGRCMPEAMFNGCLAIARYTGGSKEQIDNGLDFTGQDIALKFSSSEQLSAILAEVGSRQTDYFQPMRERAFSTVNHFYSSESNINSIFCFYEYILSRQNH